MRSRVSFDGRNAAVWLAAVSICAMPVGGVWVLVAFFGVGVGGAASAVGSVGTLMVVAFGATFAVYQFRLFRHYEPHLSVTQDVAHRAVSDSYVAIMVTAELRNTSRVVVHISETLFRVQQFDHFSDQEIERLYAETFVDRNHNQIQWPTLDEVVRSWQPGEIAIEPGEVHTETYEFIIGQRYRSLIVYSLFYNPQSSEQPESRKGWHATSVYSVGNDTGEIR